jgi:hypothetical protein
MLLVPVVPPGRLVPGRAMNVSVSSLDVAMAMAMAMRPDDAGHAGACKAEEQDHEQRVQPELAEGIPSHGIELKPGAVQGTSDGSPVRVQARRDLAATSFACPPTVEAWAHHDHSRSGSAVPSIAPFHGSLR